MDNFINKTSCTQVELWSRSETENILVGIASTELRVLLPGLLFDKWLQLEGDPALGDVSLLVSSNNNVLRRFVSPLRSMILRRTECSISEVDRA